MRAAVGDERLLIGELYLPIERLVAYYDSGLDMPANFHLLSTAWEPGAIADLVERYEAALPAGAWPNWVLGNHDRPRVASRHRPGQERAAAFLLLTLRGTPTLYYGDELGMRDVEIAPEERVDPWVFGNRDPVRTPMQWDAEGSFTSGEPWLPFARRPRAGERRRPARGPGLAALALPRACSRCAAPSRTCVTGAYRTLEAGDDVLRFARGDSLEVRIDFAAGDGEILRHGAKVRARTRARTR